MKNVLQQLNETNSLKSYMSGQVIFFLYFRIIYYFKEIKDHCFGKVLGILGIIISGRLNTSSDPSSIPICIELSKELIDLSGNTFF